MAQDKAAYSAFISYSHALDGTLAPTLQREIERFAKPWFRMRMLRVFRDDANLSAQPDLWSAIENALSASDWLILMASPDAAQSPWVNKEVSWWLANRSVDNLLIVVTSGEFVWDQERGDVAADASTAIPPALHGELPAEPRWVDLRWLHDATQVDRSNPRLRESVADIAATIREVPKDLLVGEHIRQHRRTMRLAWSGSVTLILLLVLSVIGFGVAVAQRDEAVNQARIATARQLAASAVANMGNRLDLAQLLAVESYRMEPGAQTRSALFQSVAASPHLVRSTPIGTKVETLATSSAARVAVAGTTSGTVLRWDLADDVTDAITVGDEAVSDVAVSGNGAQIIATDGAKTVLWSTENNQSVPVSGTDVRKVAISPSGRLAATFAAPDVGSHTGQVPPPVLTLVDGRTGEEIRQTTIEDGMTDVIMGDEDTIVVLNGGGEWQTLSTDSLTTTGVSTYVRGKTPANNFVSGYSSTGWYFGFMKYQKVLAVDNFDNDLNLIDYDNDTGYLSAGMPIAQAELLAISEHGTYAAAAGGGSLYAAPLLRDPGGEPLPDPFQLSGQGRAEAMAFLGDGPELVTAAEGNLTLWNITQPSPLSSRPQVEMPSSPNSGGVPRLSVSPDGTRVAIANDSTGWNEEEIASPAIHDFSGKAVKSTRLSPDYAGWVPLWAPDGNRLLMITNGGGADVLEDGRVTARWPARGETTIVGAQFSSDGSRVILLDDVGGTQVRDAATGDVRASTPAVLHDDEGTHYESAAVNGATEMAAFVSHPEIGSSRVTVIDIRQGRATELPGRSADSVALSDDNLFVQNKDGSLEIWDATGTTKIRTTTGNVGYSQALTVVPNTDLLVRLRGDGTAVISELDSGDVIGSITLPPMTRSSVTDPGAVTTLTATRNTGELITATSGGLLTYWRLTDEAWLDMACDRASRDLTTAEWQRVAATDPPDDLHCHR